MIVNPYQAGPKCKHGRMACRAFVKLPLDVDGVDAIIDTQLLKTPNIILVNLVASYTGRNPDIGTLSTDRGDIFLE